MNRESLDLRATEFADSVQYTDVHALVRDAYIKGAHDQMRVSSEHPTIDDAIQKIQNTKVKELDVFLRDILVHLSDVSYMRGYHSCERFTNKWLAENGLEGLIDKYNEDFFHL